MTEVLIFASIITPIITALVEVIKRTANIPINYIPVISLTVGLLVGYTGQPFTELAVDLRLWAGGLAGLASVGLFEVVKQREGNSKEGE